MPRPMRSSRRCRRRSDLPHRGANPFYGTIRPIERDAHTFLAWARERWACVIFDLHVEHDPEGLGRTSGGRSTARSSDAGCTVPAERVGGTAVRAVVMLVVWAAVFWYAGMFVGGVMVGVDYMREFGEHARYGAALDAGMRFARSYRLEFLYGGIVLSVLGVATGLLPGRPRR